MPCEEARIDGVVRTQVLRTMGASEAETQELLHYNANNFSIPSTLDLPFPDEPFVAVWEEYARDAGARGVIPTLCERLPQLRFPIELGISQTPEYLAATRRGVLPPSVELQLGLEAPERISLFLHSTPAGRVPVILPEHRADFVALVRAMAGRNEPLPVSASQGASIVAGYINWDRVARLHAAFDAGQLRLDGVSTWPEALRALRDRKALYQDCFILLSGGPYSGVTAEEVGLAREEWRRLSITIRLEHECAHYFTRRVFGSMRNTLLDELIADYAGITAAVGSFRADWFLRFLGLEDPHSFRQGGRLENYLGTPPLTLGALEVLQRLVRRAAVAVEHADSAISIAASTSENRAKARARLMVTLATFTLEELADEGAAERITSRARAAAERDPECGWKSGSNG